MFRPRFHLAFPVSDLDEARGFYVGVLGCREGRSSETWVDFEFFGHQLSAHLSDRTDEEASNEVDGDQVPVRHFGAILEWGEWEAMAERLEVAGVEFMIRPRVRFEGAVGEQGTFFVRDPSRNVIELKSFRDDEQVFAR
ncbi:MAG: VOC family protein [Deltaproteobacteria bacterium]|nr:VOC family protein [Deltaproteobacteria bacterium]